MAWDSANPTTTSKIKDGPAVFIANWDVIEDWSATEHYGLDNATLSGRHKPGLCGVVMVNTTTIIDALTDVPCAIAFDTTLQVFKYNTGAAWTNIGGPIEQGTKMLFYANTAPTGWTLANTLNDKLVFVTKGSAAGGQTGGGAHSTGTWTWTGHEHAIAAHDHGGTGTKTADVEVEAYVEYASYGTAPHAHTITTQTLTLNSNADDATWRPAAYCFIICTKD